jgi:uncharacterized protein YdhG (YjbR/CyaY superfamily)
MLVEDMIADLPVSEKKITMALRNLVLESAPMLHEKLSYGVPYYYKKAEYASYGLPLCLMAALQKE